MDKVMSGASKVLPKEFAYLRRIISRTSSTKSSSRIWTSVADALGRLTQILRCSKEVMFGRLGVKYSLKPPVGRVVVLALAGGRSARGGASMSVFTTLALALATILWRRVSVSGGRWKLFAERVGEVARTRPGWLPVCSETFSLLLEAVTSPDVGR